MEFKAWKRIENVLRILITFFHRVDEQRSINVAGRWAQPIQCNNRHAWKLCLAMEIRRNKLVQDKLEILAEVETIIHTCSHSQDNILPKHKQRCCNRIEAEQREELQSRLDARLTNSSQNCWEDRDLSIEFIIIISNFD